MKYTVTMHGGLGDVLLSYLKRDGDSGYVPALKIGYPESFVSCNIMSTAPAAAELFSECPWFNGVNFKEWDGDLEGFKARVNAEYFPVDRVGNWTRPKIFLTDDELDRAYEVTSDGPFIAFHPFAGTDNRNWFFRIDLVNVIDRLCDAGFRVVLLGASSRRTEGKTKDTRVVELIESFDYQRPRLVNLVGKASVRLQAKLASKSACFVGSFSSYYCVAFSLRIPSYVIAPIALMKFFQMEHPVFGTLIERPDSYFNYFESLERGRGDRLVEFAKTYANV